ncbi:hypothetical protein [Sphingobacterium sp. HMA12]|uniref:hypothetical protein n=1 Tax=Sphingobacterium sp. HMA12 TaxID=2050894 RepID=UPI000CEA4B95|nr:hypothetical protein [Sphingobacterium sp. HMA12]
MKTNTKNLANQNGRLPYEAPRMNALHVELEYSVAAGSTQGSVNGSMTESWQTETQSQDLDW